MGIIAKLLENKKTGSDNQLNDASIELPDDFDDNMVATDILKDDLAKAHVPMMDAVDEVTERKIQLDEQHDDKALAQLEEKASLDNEKDVKPDAKPKTSNTYPLK